MSDAIYFNTPAGRIVQGDVYQGNANNQEGQPNIYKSGPQIGQPYNNYFIGLAIPKNVDQGTNTYIPWESEPWGQQIMQVARTTNPASFDPATGLLFPGRKMAYKITDGDSNIPNQKMKKPCDQTGFPGHWVMALSNNGTTPPITSHMVNGVAVALLEPIIKRGHWVEVRAELKGNDDTRNPGVFLSHKMVNHLGYDEEIFSGPDIASAGFGQQAVPAQVSATPVGTQQQAPVPQQQAPVPQQQAPVPQQQAPVPQQQAPVPQQQAPVPQQQAPVPQQQAPVPQQQAPVPQQQAPVPQQQVVPATDLVSQQQEQSYIIDGQAFSRSVLLATPGYTEAILATLQKAQ